LIKAYVETEPLSEKRRAQPIIAGGKHKGPSEHIKSSASDPDAYGSVLHCNGDTPDPVCYVYRRTGIEPAVLPADAFKRTGVGDCPYAPFEEIFFPVYGKIARITNNSNNSGTTGYVRNLLGFPGFLEV
jgi:hypothetical protein